jgi:hypothetical protein
VRSGEDGAGEDGVATLTRTASVKKPAFFLGSLSAEQVQEWEISDVRLRVTAQLDSLSLTLHQSDSRSSKNPGRLLIAAIRDCSLTGDVQSSGTALIRGMMMDLHVDNLLDPAGPREFIGRRRAEAAAMTVAVRMEVKGLERRRDVVVNVSSLRMILVQVMKGRAGEAERGSSMRDGC